MNLNTQVRCDGIRRREDVLSTGAVDGEDLHVGAQRAERSHLALDEDVGDQRVVGDDVGHAMA